MMCSYPTITRYHENNYTGGEQARTRKSLEDIRLDHRVAIYQARLKLKCTKMLKNRRIFEDLAESDSSDSDTYYDQDDNETNPSTTPNYQLDLTEQPSIYSWDQSSQASSYHPSPCSEQDILSYFIDTPSQSPASYSSTSSKQNKAHQPFRALKELNVGATSPSRKQRCTLDTSQTKLEFEALRNALSTHSISDEQSSLLIHNHYQALLNPLRTFGSDELPQVLKLLSTLIIQQSLKPETLLMILQQGLMMHTCHVFARQDLTCDENILAMIVNIVDTYPAAVPFMIDSMTTSNFWNQLKNELQLDNVENVLPRLQIYHKLTSFAMSQLYSNEPIQPLLPPVLLQTGVSSQTLESYSPLNTLNKLYSVPEILVLIKEHCLHSSYYNRSELVTTVLQILATTLQYIHVISSMESPDVDSAKNSSIVKLLDALEGSDKSLATIITSLTRTITTSQYSEHNSQGVGTNTSSVRSLNHCNQFLSFFSQYYTPLAAKYGDFMRRYQDKVSCIIYKPLDL